MSELKKCPFCGGSFEIVKTIDLTFNLVHEATNHSCPLGRSRVYSSEVLAVNAVNTRPIEDALQKRIDELESENKALRLIAGSHSMSELRRKRIMAGDKWFKYPEAPRGEQ